MIRVDHLIDVLLDHNILASQRTAFMKLCYWHVLRHYLKKIAIEILYLMVVRTRPTTLLSVLIRNSVSSKEIWLFFPPWTMIKCPFLFWPPEPSEPNLQPNLKLYRRSWPVYLCVIFLFYLYFPNLFLIHIFVLF